MANKQIRHALSITTDETVLIHALIKAAIAFQEDSEDAKVAAIHDVIRISPSVNSLHGFRRKVSQILHGNPEAGYGKGLEVFDIADMEAA